MASKTLLFLALFSATVSVILSIPQVQILPDPPQEPMAGNADPPRPNELVIDPRTFGSLFNLSAYLQNAPTNSAALNFVPLITLLSAKVPTG